MKKKLIIALVIVIIMIIALPLVANAAIATGSIYSYMNGGIHQKYTYINGANVSLQWISNGTETWLCYPFASPNMGGSGDTPSGTAVSAMGMDVGSVGTYAATVYPRVGGDYTNWGAIYPTSGITNEKVKVAAAIILLTGYGRSSMYTNYGIDYIHAQYATNVAIQNLAALSCGGVDNTYYSPTSGNEGTAAYSFYMGQLARQYLANSSPKPLGVDGTSAMNVEGAYFTTTLTFSLPTVIGAPNTNFYRNDYGINNVLLPAGTIFEGYTAVMDGTGKQQVKIKIPIAGNEGKTFNTYCLGRYINRTATVNLYNISGGYTRQVAADDQVAVYTNDIDTPLTYFTLTTPTKPDLVVTSVTKNKASYNAGDAVTITATVKNSGSVACGGGSWASIGYSSTYFTPVSMGNQYVGNLAPGASATVTYTATAKASAAAADTTVTVTADSTGLIPEFSEANNTGTATLHINKSMPDLVVDSVLTNKDPTKMFEAGETITITAKVTNIGNLAAGASVVRLSQVSPDGMQPIGFDQGTAPVANATYDTNIGALAINASTTVSWSFVTPIRISAQTVNATVTADATKLITELLETNNTQTIALTLNPGKPDFLSEFKNMTEGTTIKAGYDAVVSTTISNIGKISCPSVGVRLTVEGVNYSDTICVPTATRNYPTGSHPDGCNVASFRIHAPDTPGTYTLTVMADPSLLIPEENESNNSATITIIVEDDIVTPVIDTIDTDMEDNYAEITTPPAFPNAPSVAWEEIRQTGPKTYETVTFTASLANTFELKPGAYVAFTEPAKADMIESGFGLEANTSLVMSSNYDKPSILVGPQIIKLYYPETNYGAGVLPGYEYYHEKMDFVAGNEYNSTWTLAENPYSTLTNTRVHYTPLWTPDGQYTAVCFAIGAWTPAGQLLSSTTDSVTIAGDLYDRFTSVSW